MTAPTAGRATEVFLWIAVVLLALTAVGTVLSDDLFSWAGRGGPDAGAARP
jgi:hypothetical protein